MSWSRFVARSFKDEETTDVGEAPYVLGYGPALPDALGRTPELRLVDSFLDHPLFYFARGEIVEELI